MLLKWILLALLFASTMLVFGLNVSHEYNAEIDIEVDAEYINGILTASGILFGIWAIVIERKPKESVQKWLFGTAIKDCFLIAFIFLTLTVFFVALNALNLFSSLFTLVACSISFFINAFLIVLSLYYYHFRDS